MFPYVLVKQTSSKEVDSLDTFAPDDMGLNYLTTFPFPLQYVPMHQVENNYCVSQAPRGRTEIADIAATSVILPALRISLLLSTI